MMSYAPESSLFPVRLRIGLSVLLFILVILVVRECATAYCGLIDENFTAARILGVEEGERVEGDSGRPSRRH
jgi:hypothetical protein